MRHNGADILKEGPGAKHPWRWEIAEHQIPSIKVLFKANTKSHKHPSIRLSIREQDTVDKQKKMAFNPGTAHSPKIQSYRMWWGAASPLLNDTPVVCICMIIELISRIHIYIYLLTQSFWAVTNVTMRKHIIQTTGFGACSSTCCQWDGEDVPAP